jgi:iron complex outermembrane receptor protein
MAPPSPADDAVPPPQADLTKMDLEDLLNVEVTSVSRREQKLSKTGAAIFVISQEDIRRSGATSIPELLRMVPGVDVARLDDSTYAISIRGFNQTFADKVLVLVDGRSVYSQTFSGVFWDQLDVPVEDIDRIEVIRGPGGTMWGANAVNGVINIITKKAGETQGGVVSASTGSKDRAGGLTQYGGQLGDAGFYRIFGQYTNTGASDTPTGPPVDDSRGMAHGGFRADLTLSPLDTLTMEGDFLRTEGADSLTSSLPNQALLQTSVDPVRSSVGDLLARWNHTLPDAGEISLQAYFNYFDRFNFGLHQVERVGDLDFQHHLRIKNRHDVVWGLGYRVGDSTIVGNEEIQILPEQRVDPLYSAFIQDEIKIADSLWFVVGSKFEHNAYTGFTNEPSVQLVWTPTERQTIWFSAAKAIRQPSRADFGLQVNVGSVPLPQGGFGVLTLLGDPNPDTEILHDFEAGYRANATRRLSLDFTVFLSYYHHLQTQALETPYFTTTDGPPHLVIPIVYGFQAHARDYGSEFFANWNAARWWKISPGVTLLRMFVAPDPGSLDTTVALTPGYSPEQQYMVRSFINLPHRMEWDQTIGYVSRLTSGDIPSYMRLDTRFGRRLGEAGELSVGGQNLLQPRHGEFPDFQSYDHLSMQRSVTARITWHF